MKPYIYLIIIMLGLASCKTADVTYEPAELSALETRLAEGNYEINLQWARPLMTNELIDIYNSGLVPIMSQTNRINILDARNYIRKSGDSVYVYLPYYGTRQMSVDIGDNNSAIRFEGVPEKYRVEFNERRQRYTVMYTFSRRTETFNVSIQVYPNGRVQVNVNCSHRTTIIYQGSMIEGEEVISAGR